MPFDPLETDEKLSEPIRAPADFDSQMLAGCTAFVGTSLLCYLLSVWPFLVFSDTHRIISLLVANGCGLIPCMTLGVFSTRKAGIPGACGLLGGVIAVAIFLNLRLQQVMLAKEVKDLPQPEYPDAWAWMIPVAWILIAIAVVAIFVPRDQFADKTSAPPSR